MERHGDDTASKYKTEVDAVSHMNVLNYWVNSFRDDFKALRRRIGRGNFASWLLIGRTRFQGSSRFHHDVAMLARRV